MILMKSCPRCNGDMMEEELLGEMEIVCLQCGYRAYPETQTKRLAPAARVERKAA